MNIIFLGIIIGVLWFFIYEKGNPGNSFYDGCWIRKQPKWMDHEKVYLLGIFLIYRANKYNDNYIKLIASIWIGLHLVQDLAERYYENSTYKELK